MKETLLNICKTLPRHAIALCLLLFFTGFQVFQFHHHHDKPHTESKTPGAASLSQKCEICNLITSRHNNFTAHNRLSIPEVPSHQISTTGFLYSTNWDSAYQVLTDNKGPPTLL